MGKLCVVLICLLIGSSYSTTEFEDDPDDTEWNSYNPIRFTQSTYKATITNRNNVTVIGSPIILENVGGEVLITIRSDNYQDYDVDTAETNDWGQLEVVLTITSDKPSKREFDILLLEVLDTDDNMTPLTRSTVLLFNQQRSFDMYRMTFQVDGKEFIVLNFLYFKWFLVLLTVTGVLILIIELYEVFKHIVRNRQNRPYKQLLTV